MGFENGQLVRVSLKATAPADFLMVNTFHYDLVGSGASTRANDPQALADFFRDNVMSHFRALFSPSFTIDPVLVQDEKDPQNPNAGRQEWTSGAAAPGTRGLSGQGVPFALCGIATLKTEHIGRRHTGRTFLPASMDESDVVFNNFTGPILDQWQAYMDAIPRSPDLITGPDPGHANWCVYSRTQRGADLDPYASKVIGVNIHTRIHWLRSRDD